MTQEKNISYDDYFFKVFTLNPFNSANLKKAYETPDSTKQFLELMTKNLTKKEFNNHISAYLNGISFALDKYKWQEKDAGNWINVMNFITRNYVAHTKKTRYKKMITDIRENIIQKMPVPQERIALWKQVIPERKMPFGIKKIGEAVNSYGIIKNRRMCDGREY